MKFRIIILYQLLAFYLNRDHKKSNEKLKVLQEKRFKKLKRHLELSGFYSRMNIRNKELHEFPIINKEIFMKNFDTINTVGLKLTDANSLAALAEERRDFSETLNSITVGLSTGTSGNKGVFLASERERAMWIAAILHRVIGLSFRKRTVAFFLRANSRLYESSGSALLKFNYFDLLKPVGESFQHLISLKADILVAQPSVLLMLAKLYEDNNIKPGFKKVISIAEILEKQDEIYLQEIFGLKIGEVYQATEGFIGFRCSKGRIHLNTDFLIIEKDYVDRESGRYNPVITDLYRRSQPVVRYRLDDILVDGDDCDCGISLPVIDRIEGRNDDIIRLPDNRNMLVDIFPDYLRRAVALASDEIRYYTICQTGIKTLEVYFECYNIANSDIVSSSILAGIENLLSKYNIKDCRVLFRASNIMETGVKLRRIRNEYN
ncbi:MAG: F390 synthetase-related protein [Marinilabiliaceae bacterium]|jgi:putative adenylate-forming enzyme|nr:F390 synthetase-related protein [Marinilabiliaceae bacterium]